MVVANHPIYGKEALRVRHSNQAAFRQQAQFLRRQFLQDGDLPFTNVLTEDVIAQALAAVTGWLDRIFLPWSPSGSSWDKSSVPTTPAAPRSPA